MTSISLITCNIFCLSQWFGSIVTVFTLFRTFRRVYVRHSPSKEWRSVFLILCLPLSLSLFPSNTLEKLFRQFCNFARGRYHLVNENIWSSAPRERTTIYYFTLHCYRFLNTLRIREENEHTRITYAFSLLIFSPQDSPSAFWRAPQRAISIQNEQKIALKI